MKKLTCLLISAVAPMIAARAAFGASCSDGLTQQTWDGTKVGYCKIFFPNCAADGLGRRLSYSRETDPAELICVGASGAYTGFYKVTLKEANGLFNTSFDKMGVNYTSDLSQWLFNNCATICGGGTPVAPAKPATTTSDGTPATDAAAPAADDATPAPATDDSAE